MMRAILTIVLFLMANALFAQPAKPTSVSDILNPDGTLRLDRDGNYDLDGYELRLDAQGRPIAQPKDAQAQSASGAWGANFGASNGLDGSSLAFAVYDGELYVGGSFSQAGSVTASNLARWNGSSWNRVGTASANGASGPINAIATYNGELYIGGNFTFAGGISASRVARWNGASWSDVGSGTNGIVNALAVYNGELYVGGSNLTFAGSVSVNNIARWNGTTWSRVGTVAANGVNGAVNALVVHNGELYVGGSFTQAGGVTANNVARWNGSSWNRVGTPTANGTNNTVNAMAVYNGELYVGGIFTTAGGVAASRIAVWNGTNWSGLDAGVNGNVRALCVYDGFLYAGGLFTLASGEPANRIARWDGTSWHAVGTGAGNGVNSDVYALAVYGNSLFLGGAFTQANVGDNPIASLRLARWQTSTANASASQGVSIDGVYSFVPTGVSIRFTGVSGSGPCTVERYDNPASNVIFASPPPAFQSQYRFVISATGFTFTEAELRFNRTQIPNSGIGNAANVRVYRRATPGFGAFNILPNAYQASTPNLVRATTATFSEFILGSDDPSNQLPVELVAFIGRKTQDGVLLSWRTASELNNAGFEVQRRSEKRGASSEEWQTLGFVRGAGTTTEAQSYSFLDRNAVGKTQYRLKQIDFDGQFEYSPIVEVDAGAPRTFALEQNYPNPFNPTTTIPYQLPVASDVSLKIYDALGKEVMTLVNGRQEAGAYRVSVNAATLSSGMYFYRLRAGNFVQTKKMMLAK